MTARSANAPPRAPGPTLAQRLASRADRWRRWEYWPSVCIYLPLVPHIAWLALRHRSLTVCTRCNPAIPLGGIVGESKSDILNLLPRSVTLPHVLVAAGSLADREAAVLRAADAVRPRDHDGEGVSSGSPFPVVLKPDVGQRGAGVSLARSPDDVRGYLSGFPGPLIVQRFHPGPFEAGVFYIRHPGQQHGVIFSITDKVFPAVTGDGQSSISQLVWAHPRYRAQARTHVMNLGPRADAVPAKGLRVEIGFAGNHARGTMFRDGAHLITPALTAAFDTIADAAPGLHFGRFDVRYTDPARFAAGEDIHIIEFNGLLSESTNIYDPDCRYWAAQRILRAQWSLAFSVGAANRAAARRR